MDSIDYYNKYASKVFEDTVNKDMSAFLEPFLASLEEGDTILDLGCGSGRDSLTFYNLGYDVTPMDAAEEMCHLAEIHTDIEVLWMDCREMMFDEAFDGIWASASLIHIPKKELPEIFEKLADALVSGGVLYLSMPQGSFEGFRGERYFSEFGEDELCRLTEKGGRLAVEKIWQSEEPDRDVEDGWLHVIARKNK